MSFTSFDLGEYQRRLQERVQATRAQRAAALASMPEFASFLDALKASGIDVAHVRVTRDDLVLEWGTPLPDAQTPGDIVSCSLVDAAIAAGKVVPIRQRYTPRRA